VSGFAGGGIELRGVTDTGVNGRALIAGNEVFGTGRGISVEDSSGGTVELRNNRVHDNMFSGIDLVNSDGLLIRGNTTRNDGTDGISLDASSDGNRVIGNMARGNTFDLSNAGRGNCFKRNRFHTSEGDIGC
jgi:parallel beta-helix repeat protein